MSKRSYKQNCALARAIDLIGERWTLLLLRDLLVSPQRYKQLLNSLKGIGTNLLATRLKELEAAGVIEQQPAGDGVRVYAMTANGQALEPAVLALIRWGLTYGPPNQAGDHHCDEWDLLALKALFQPGRAAGLNTTVQFDDLHFKGWVRIAQGEMQIGTGSTDAADLVINGTITDLFLGSPNPLDHLVKGTARSLEQFMAAFAQGEPVAASRQVAAEKRRQSAV